MSHTASQPNSEINPRSFALSLLLPLFTMLQLAVPLSAAAQHPPSAKPASRDLNLTQVTPAWSLLAEPEVQRDLKLDAAQVGRVESILKQADVQVERELTRQGAAARAISRRGWALQIATPELRKLGEALPPDQQRRLTQVTVQQFGPRALDCPGVPESLGISEAACRAIAARQTRVAASWQNRIMAFAKEHHVPMVGSKGGPQPENAPAIRGLEARRDTAVWSVLRRSLSRGQMTRLDRLRGSPLVLSRHD